MAEERDELDTFQTGARRSTQVSWWETPTGTQTTSGRAEREAEPRQMRFF